MEEVRERYLTKKIATLHLRFYKYLSSVCKWFSLPHKHGESLSHLNGRESKI